MDLDEQENELLALQSIFDSEEFIRYESKFAGEIRVSLRLPADFYVVLKCGGETLRQYDISYLPPLLLTFELPEDYPSSSPPFFTLTCIWLTHPQLALLSAQLTDLYQATGGAVVLFSWIQFLKEDTLKLLDIHSLLELPFDKPTNQSDNKDRHDTELSQAENNPNTLKSEAIDVSDLCGPDLSVSSREILSNSSTSAKNRDSQGTSASKTDYPKALSSQATTKNQNGSDATAPQISEFKTENQKDHFSTADTSKLLSTESVKSSQEDVFDQSASVMPPSSSSNPQYPSIQAASPLQTTEISPDKEQTFSGLSLTPSQKLLSQILIYDAVQKQKAFDTTVFNCGVCYAVWLGSECVQLHECSHVFCRACLGEFCKIQITEGNVQAVTCPQGDCASSPTPGQVKSLVGEELFGRYDRLLLQSTLESMSDVTYCPRQSCSSAVILEKSSNAAMCSVCGFAFCANCKKTYHGTSECYDITTQKSEDFLLHVPQSEEGIKALLDDYLTGSKERRHLLERRYGRQMLLSIGTNLNEKWVAVNTKACPHCFCPIQKDGGCYMMYCTQCQRQFMWL